MFRVSRERTEERKKTEMSVKLRLTRIGKTKQPQYRIAQPTERVKKLLEISGAWGEYSAARSK